ncbi:MAG: 50S ribosomal protein L24 [Spirochaetaceae bacterium]
MAEGTTKLKKNDNVIVIAGKDKGKTGRILRIEHGSHRVVVEGVNLVKKAVRKRRQNDRAGIIEVEAPLHVSNVMAVTKNGRPSRVGIRIDGNRKVRYLKKTGEEL